MHFCNAFHLHPYDAIHIYVRSYNMYMHIYIYFYDLVIRFIRICMYSENAINVHSYDVIHTCTFLEYMYCMIHHEERLLIIRSVRVSRTISYAYRFGASYVL